MKDYCNVNNITRSDSKLLFNTPTKEMEFNKM